MSAGTNLSKEFFDLLKAIGESKSKQEEDRIILKEIQTLKKKLDIKSSSQTGAGPSAPGLPGQKGGDLLSSKKRSKEFLVRLLYVEMLGHDASFGYIKAVEMAASGSLYHKRTGYLICGACLPPSHEFRFMLVNCMQRDLQSSHVLEICAGLIASCQLITSDMVPAMSGEVIKLLTHGSETVRKKAIITLHRFYQLAPESVTKEQLQDLIRKVLCDRDPAVMGSSLNIIEALAAVNPQPYKDLIPSLVSILKQIGEHRLPTDFDYHRVPAPWMQMKIIRILGILGQGDASASSGMYEILNETMKKADIGINAGYAIVYECVRTIVTIYPNPTLLDAAAGAISRFIQSRSHNLKYLGVTGLAAVVESHPQYAAQHQMEVMDCLEDPDETLQRKTLDLLYKLVNPVNVEFITERLIEFLRNTTDIFLKSVLTTRICTVAERYAPNNEWYIRTITELFEISGDLVKHDVAQNLMTLIAEGSGEDDGYNNEDADMELRQRAVELYATLLKTKSIAKLPRILIETMSWCLGEYGYLAAAVSSTDDICLQLCDVVRRNKNRLSSTTLHFIITAIMKLIAQAGHCPPHAAVVIDDLTKSADFDLQQRCLEFQNMLTSASHLLGDVLPVDASCEDIDVDVNLSFLDGFVYESIQNGAKEYEKPEDMDDDDDDYGSGMYRSGTGQQQESAFKLTPYEKPTTPTAAALSAMRSGSSAAAAGVNLPPGASSSNSGGSGIDPYNAGAPPSSGGAAGGGDGELRLNVRNAPAVWGKGGLAQSKPAAPAAPTAGPSVSGAFGSAATGSTEVSAAAAPAVGGYGGGGGFGAPAPPAEPEKPRELTEKERRAALMFGGVVPGQAPPAAPAPAPRRPVTAAAPAPAATAAPSPVSAPAPAPPAAAPEIDLLGFGDEPAAEPAPAPNAAAVVDIFAPAPVDTSATVPVVPPAEGVGDVAVETVSDDEGDGVEEVEVAPTPAPEPAPAVDADPFAASGLLDGFTDKPLASFQTQVDNTFEYGGSRMAPLDISTAQFGQHWGQCTATSPVSLDKTTKVDTLDKFMELSKSVGLHPIEAIVATNEGICAGMVSGTQVALVHGKVTPLGGGASKLDVTIKSTDQGMSGCLAVVIQNLMR